MSKKPFLLSFCQITTHRCECANYPYLIWYALSFICNGLGVIHWPQCASFLFRWVPPSSCSVEHTLCNMPLNYSVPHNLYGFAWPVLRVQKSLLGYLFTRPPGWPLIGPDIFCPVLCTLLSPHPFISRAMLLAHSLSPVPATEEDPTRNNWHIPAFRILNCFVSNL